jgi:ketosteroid isomerase-like protein
MDAALVTDARSAIADVRHRYCWAYDDGDADALAALFTPDGVIDLGDWGRFEGPAAIAEGIRAQVVAPGEPPATLHTLSVPVIDVDGDRADGNWDVVVYHRPRAGDVHPVRFVGRYFDTYRRIGGQWMLASIRLEQFWFAGY